MSSNSNTENLQNGENQRPLNGKMLPRLINMRLERARNCNCVRCDDLLSAFHKNRARLTREHNSEQWALRFWTDSLQHQQLSDPYAVSVREHAHAALEIALLEEIVDSLLSAEKKWQSAQSDNCLDDDTDQNWIRHFLITQEEIKKAQELQSV